MPQYKEIAYALLRATVGVMLLFFGIGKLSKGIGPFASGMVKRFAESPLPELLVKAFAYALPFVEVTIGSLLILGLFTRVALASAAALMMALTLGAVVEPSPPTAASNVNYALVIFVLLWLSEYDYYSIDRFRGRVKG